MNWERVQLLDSNELMLQVQDGDGQQFIKYFRHCWAKIPADEKQSILEYWKKEGDNYPFIELSDCWSDSKDCLGQCTQRCRVISFSANGFKHIPEAVAHWVIAHELGHVFQKTQGKAPGGESEEQNERDADNIVKRWGFENSHHNLLKWFWRGEKTIEEACAEMKRFGLK